MKGNRLLPLAISVVLLLAALGCSSNKVQNSAQTISAEDHQFFQLIDRYKRNPDSVSYHDLWDAYLLSSQPEETVAKHGIYLAAMAKLESKELTCSDIDWESIVRLNYWSLKPHFAAVECYQSLGDQEKAHFHESFVSFILQGVFSSGNGEHFYNAYEAASWGDVQDLLALAGYQYVDTYLDLRGANQGVYYVVVAEDADSGVQRLIYFDNVRFINRVLGHAGRFNSSENSLGFTVATSLANSVGHAAIALGDILAAGKEYQVASEWYLKSTLRESPVAYMRLAKLCIKKRITYSEEACLEFITKAAELNYFEAFILLSGLYSEGILVDKDPSLAKDFLQIAFEKYDKGGAYSLLGDYYVNGLLGQKQYSTAKKYYKKALKNGYISNSYVRLLNYQFSKKEIKQRDYYGQIKMLADKGNALAQFKYGAKYLVLAEDDNDQEAAETARKYIQLAADQLLPRALYALGVMYEYGLGVEKNKDKAIDSWYLAGSRWHAAAQYEVGQFLRHKSGFGNEKKAFNWIHSSARQGDDDAYVTLGYFYEHATGTAKSLKNALKYYKKAAAENNQTGLYNYGYFLRYGKGIKIDLELALDYFLKASDKGSGGAANEIGIMYDEGIFVEKDFNKAFSWYQKSAERGYRWAQYNLATMYEKGDGVEKNLAEALNWYQKAAKQGHRAAIVKLKEFKSQNQSF